MDAIPIVIAVVLTIIVALSYIVGYNVGYRNANAERDAFDHAVANTTTRDAG